MSNQGFNSGSFKERQAKPKIQAQDLRSHIELKLEQNPRASPMGVASTTKGEHTGNRHQNSGYAPQ